MATFPSVAPSYGIQKDHRPNFKRTKFGDGYEQVAKFGINNNPQEWTLTFENISESDSDSIETFLNSRADDAASFNWLPPNESGSATDYQWRCFEWNKRIDYPTVATISCTFTQVFEA
jgi:phage-related protein